MEIQGTVFRILPATSGVSARGEWHRQDVIFEVPDGAYSRKVCVTFFNKQQEVSQIVEGQQYNVSINIESREFNGRWYTDIRAWRLQNAAAQPAAQPASEFAAAPAPAAAPMPSVAPVVAEPSYATAEEVDDLPF